MLARSWILVWIPLVIAACGDGESNEPIVSSPTVSVSTTTVSAHAKLTDETVEPGSIALTLTNLPRQGLYVEAESTENGVASLQVNEISETQGEFRIDFKKPYTVRPGTYTDTMTLALCLDEACTKPIKGSPIHFTSEYTVADVPSNEAPQLTLTSESVRKQVLLSGQGTTTVPVYAQVSRIPSFAMTVQLTQTNQGIDAAAFDEPLNGPSALSNLSSALELSYRDPTSIGEGFYEDTVTLNICLDPACVNPIAGSPKTIRVQYQVGNSLPGPNGYTVKEVPVTINDLAWDAAHSKVYLSVASESVTHPNSIAIVDPATAEIESTLTLSDEPQRIAVSNDGQFLYVALDTTSAVQRFQLPALTLDQTLSLGADSNYGPHYAHDIQVAPNNPRLLAVARTNASASHFLSNTTGIALYDDTAMRPQVGNPPDSPTPTNYADWILWNLDGTSLFGGDSRTNEFTLQTFSVSTSGLTLQALAYSVAQGRFSYANGLLYTDGSQVFNPDSGTIVGTVPASLFNWQRRRVLADSSTSRIFALSEDFAAHIEIFDLETRAPLQTATMLDTHLNFLGHPPFIRWGADGLAYAAEGKVVLIHGPFLIQ